MTPDIDLTQMELPDRVKRDTGFDTSWRGIDYRYPQDLIVQYFQTGDGFSSNSQEKILIRYPYKGVATVDRDYIRYTDNDDYVTAECRILLTASTSGALDEQFLAGGTIVSRFSIYQDIEVY